MKIIHGSYAEEQASAAAPTSTDYKSCPICGAVCFADMEVCFGCLHQFSESDAPRSTQHDQITEETSQDLATQPASSMQAENSASNSQTQESYSEEELAALLDQMRNNFALPTKEGIASLRMNEPAEVPRALEPQTQTAGAGQDGNGMTTRHVCEGKDGQQFEITISIKLL